MCFYINTHVCKCKSREIVTWQHGYSAWPCLVLLGSAWPCSVSVASLVGGQGGHGPPKILGFTKYFKRSARFKRNFRHNCMPVLGLA